MHITRLFMHGGRASEPMATDLHNQTLRRTALVRILRDSAVGKQAELVRLLRREGFSATQSSVSRDLRELGVAKAGDRYLVPADEDALSPSHFETVRSFVKSCRNAGTSLTVVRTTSGAAQSVALAIDKARWPEVVGTLAGDDTIFIASDSARGQRRLLERLRTSFAR
jgi:transcriptional regulator of arginine metabolism